MKYVLSYFPIVLIILGLGACRHTDAPNRSIQKRYVWVDKLMVRDAPKLGAREIAILREGEAVIYLDSMTQDLVRMPLWGYEFEGAFIKISTQAGVVGWIHEKAVRKTPIPIRYRALIAFSAAEDVSEEWQGLYHDIHNLYMNTPIWVSYVVNEFDHVPVYNQDGEEMTYIDLSEWVEQYRRGYVCLQAGKDPYVFPIARPEQMQVKIDAYFGRR